MVLTKLTIKVETSENNFRKDFKVLFNPNQIEITKSGWTTKEGSSEPRAVDSPATVKLDLFFDTTLQLFKKNGAPRTPSEKPENVQNYTQDVYALVQPSIGTVTKRPPRCQLIWGTISGNGSVLMPDGYLEQVTKKLTHFLEDGTPVRATLTCTFKEWEPSNKQQKRAHLIDDPVRMVRSGETLTSIAHEEYGDAALWRVIAKENRLSNPRVHPGQVLTVPPLRLP